MVGTESIHSREKGKEQNPWHVHAGLTADRSKLQEMPGNLWHYLAPFIQAKIPHLKNG